MYKPPTDDESPRENEDETGIYTPVYPRRSTYGRRPVDQPRQQFYADEHPEIPRVRRASLQQSKSNHQPISENGLEGLEDTDKVSFSYDRTKPQARLTSKQKRAKFPPFAGLDSQSDKTQPQSPPTGKHKREMLPLTGFESWDDTAKHERLSQHRASRRKIPIRVPNTLSAAQKCLSSARKRMQLHRMRRKGWLLIGLVILLILVLVPLLTGILRKQQNNSLPGIPISRLQSVPSNSHELVIVPPDTDHPAPPILATSAYLLDTDNETTLYAQNPYLHLPMLSTTKLMTAALAVQMGNLDQQITITPQMEHDINQLSADSALFGVKQGQTYSLRDLLYGLLYVSGNDAALVIADALAGSVQNFVAKMNQKAQDLGLHDTHFVNPHGLEDPGQYSCARDLAVLGQYSLSIPTIQQISDGRSYQIPAGGSHPARVVLNENQFLWWYPGVTGGKTGYDGVSDFVQVMQVTRNKRHMIGVVIHTVNWWTDMRDLMDYGSDDYTWDSPRNVELSGQPIPYDNLWDDFAKDTQDISVPTANGGVYYVYTGYDVSGPLLTYFNQQGGLKKFGYPIKMPAPSGTNFMGQQFQHGAILCNLTTNQCRTA